MRATAATEIGQFAGGMHAPEVFAPIGIDNDRRLERRRHIAVPGEKLFAVAAECDFDEMCHDSIYRVAGINQSALVTR